MSLDAALSIAPGGLANINRQLARGVAERRQRQHARLRARGRDAAERDRRRASGMGVHSGPAQPQRRRGAAGGHVAAERRGRPACRRARRRCRRSTPCWARRARASDLPSLLGKMQDAFSTLADRPRNQTQQQAVVSAAGTLATGSTRLSSAYTGQRQAAKDAIVNRTSTR